MGLRWILSMCRDTTITLWRLKSHKHTLFESDKMFFMKYNSLLVIINTCNDQLIIN